MPGKKEVFVRICPQCASIDIHTDFSNPVVWSEGTTVKYQCGSCQHLGNFFPEVLRSKIDEYKKELEKDKKLGIIKETKSSLIDGTTGFSAMIVFGIGSLLIGGLVMIITGLFSPSSLREKAMFIGGGILLLVGLYLLYHQTMKEIRMKKIDL